ncbi:hypothetical protein BDV19DRAFT_385253 [Aspergillus venezuelensis]
MHTILLTALLGLASASSIRRRDITQPSGTNPVTFAGSWYALYGDSLYCESGVSDPADDTGTAFNGMVRDAVARLGDDPLSIEWTALNANEPFIPNDESYGETSSTGFGGTSICAVNDTTAMVFYLPVVTQRFGETGYWWDSNTTPRYGDIAAYRDEKSDQYVYQVRVKAGDAFDPAKYDYWWGRAQRWKIGKPLTEFTSDTAVMWSVGQGQVVNSEYYQVYMFVHFAGGDGEFSPVLTFSQQEKVLICLDSAFAIRTAHALEGPWSDDVTFYTPTAYEGGMVYAVCAHPYLDESGKTLTISYTNANHIQVIKATFE